MPRALTGQFQLANFAPAAQANVWQYGEAQDTAQSQTTDGHSALANFTANLTVNGSTFSYSFPAYSMTVLDLGKASSGNCRADDHQSGIRHAQPRHRHDDRPFGHGDRSLRQLRLDLHLVDHRLRPLRRSLLAPMARMLLRASPRRSRRQARIPSR